MNRIKKYLTVKWCAMISALLGMLGFAACGSKGEEDGFGPCLYGQPHADFKVEGSVLNEEGAPISGVKVYVKGEYGDTARTDQNGKYVIKDNSFLPYTNVWMMAVDPSGVYERDSVKITPQYEGGDGNWDNGSSSTTQDFTLKKKPAEPEEPENPEDAETNPEETETLQDPETPETPSESGK